MTYYFIQLIAGRIKLIISLKVNKLLKQNMCTYLNSIYLAFIHISSL